jgi:3-hydroxyacyl-CoA dehydrogenase
MNPLVHLDREGDVAIITIDNPPVNALSEIVIDGIDQALIEASKDPAVAAIVLMAAGRTFPAGADIKELEGAAKGKGSGGPQMHDRLLRFEDCPKPLIVAVHGNCLGGGCEIAMGGHYRIAAPSTSLGQPEVNLGLIPGAEGTQRLPRLVGIANALELCVSGRPIKAPQALEMGLIDAIASGDLKTDAIAFAKSKVGAVLPRTSQLTARLGDADANAPLYEAAKKNAAKIRRMQTAPLAAIEAVKAGAELPFNDGCLREAQLFKTCIEGEQARAMIHAFFAERAVAKYPGITKDTKVYDIRSAALIGAGTMGQGISMALANAGIKVLLKDTAQESLDRAMKSIEKNYAGSVAKGRFTQEVMNQRMALIQPTLTYDGFEKAGLIIEAAFESMGLKKKLFAEIDAVAKPDCVLATNTSTLDIDAIAAVTARPQMVVGLHFFSPAHVMRLVEIVRGKATSLEILATAFAIAKKLGKVGVVVGNCQGFVGNRMMLPYMRESQLLVEEGATPAQCDQVMTQQFGMAMGIFAVDDMGGIDLAWRVRQEYKHQEKPGMRQPAVLEKLYEMKRWGQKTGSGWFKYEGGREPVRDREVESLIEETANAAGIPRREICPQEIIDRSVLIMVNEAAKILEEGHAVRAADIDVIYLTGYGFPGFRGGPMKYADNVGLKKVYERICEFRDKVGEWWEPAPLLKQLAEAGSSFDAWDETKLRD